MSVSVPPIKPWTVPPIEVLLRVIDEPLLGGLQLPSRVGARAFGVERDEIGVPPPIETARNDVGRFAIAAKRDEGLGSSARLCVEELLALGDDVRNEVGPGNLRPLPRRDLDFLGLRSGGWLRRSG